MTLDLNELVDLDLLPLRVTARAEGTRHRPFRRAVQRDCTPAPAQCARAMDRPHPEDQEIVVALLPAAAGVLAALRPVEWRRGPDGRLIVHLLGPLVPGDRRRLLALGAACEVLEPAGLRGWMARELRAAAAQYEEGQETTPELLISPLPGAT